MNKLKYTLRLCVFLCISGFSSFAQNTNGNWQIVGPIAFPTNTSGQINGIGRVSQIKFHATNALKMYAVSASGGLWITGDGGNNWNKTGTDALPVTTATASVCIDYTNDNILYLGTGDGNYEGSPSYGIWKSLDGGVNWAQSSNGIGITRVAYDILMSPVDHNVLIASSDDGIWKSTDGGANWIVKKAGGRFESMAYMPGSSTIMYAVGDEATGFWRSSDGGDTWVFNATVVAKGNGGRVAVTEADSNVVYVGFTGSNSNTAGGEIYKSTDGGLTFTMKKGDVAPNLVGYDPTTSGQGNYNFDIGTDRLNANILYLVAHCIWKSVDSGVTWLKLTDWPFKCHSDMHDILTSPYDNTKLFCANDGGIFLSTDGGNEWTPKSDGISATEIYHMANSKLSRNITSIGTQDNGELYGDGSIWYTNRGGDETSTFAFDYVRPITAYHISDARRYDLLPSNPSGASIGLSGPTNVDRYAFSKLNTNLLFASTGGSINRSTNIQSTSPTWKSLKNFTGTIKALAISPLSDNEVLLVTNDQKVYRSTNALASKPTFTLVSTAPSSTATYANIVMLKSNPNIVYMSCGNRMYKSINKGTSWTNISGTLPLVSIVSLVQDEYKTDESVYIATAARVYYRNTSFSDWSGFAASLPVIAEISDLAIYNDGTSNSVLRVGTWGRGVWESPLYNVTAPFTLGSMSKNLLKDQLSDDSPSDVTLYPNPASDKAFIKIAVANESLALLQFTDASGKIISWSRQNLNAGENNITIETANLPVGIYFVLLRIGEQTISKKLVINR